MSVIREEIIEINFWSPPLKKHQYSVSSLKKKALPDSGTGSGILIEEIKRREALASGILEERERSAALQTSYVNPYEVTPPEGELPPATPEEAAPPRKKQLRRLKKLSDMLYDDTAVKLGELEDEAYDVLNADGFYDEILPVDYGTENEDMERDINYGAIAIYGGILVLTIGIMIATVLILF